MSLIVISAASQSGEYSREYASGRNYLPDNIFQQDPGFNLNVTTNLAQSVGFQSMARKATSDPPVHR
ncbi:hypothetical protein Pmani_031926 [Petrolisthes manimaculis]|uniref:Uncharacterized protein n=1 Tax=Petrolisthes manimaculis TaxID=1843537 RepID=A0AAE1NSQ5_9EUCA|nr:hypothetical protein Pmani_031926 [Petrolisthes manimaculis]